MLEKKLEQIKIIKNFAEVEGNRRSVRKSKQLRLGDPRRKSGIYKRASVSHERRDSGRDSVINTMNTGGNGKGLPFHGIIEEDDEEQIEMRPL